MTPRNHWILAILLTLAGTAGCDMTGEPVWRPDSKGFVFTRADGSMDYFDLAKAGSLQLVPAMGIKPNLPAISPDHQFVATALALNGPNGHNLSINFLKLEDGSTVRNDEQSWGTPDERRQIAPTRCFWCPTGKRIIITYGNAIDNGPLRAVVFDVKTYKMAELNLMPLTAMYTLFGVSPMLPDGTGYLAGRDSQSEAVVSVVSWDGWEQQITFSDSVKSNFLDLVRSEKSQQEKRDKFLPFPSGRWEGMQLHLPTKLGNVVIDTKSRYCMLTGKDRWTQATKQVTDVFARTPNEQAFAVIAIDNAKSLVCWQRGIGATSVFGVDLTDTATGRRKVIEPNHTLVGSGNPLFPSPDGKYVLAFLQKGEERMLYVIDANGTVKHRLVL